MPVPLLFLMEWLPEGLRELWAEYSPHGIPATFLVRRSLGEGGSLRQGILCVSVSQAKRVVNSPSCSRDMNKPYRSDMRPDKSRLWFDG